MKTRQQMAAEAGVTEAQLDKVEEVLEAEFPDPAKRAEFVKAIVEIRRFARANNMTVSQNG